MPHPIFEIDELVRLVIDELVKTSPKTAVSFALTCRSLEEPTLSSLWKQRESLDCLLRVLPSRTWVEDNYGAFVSGCDFPVYRIRYRSPQTFERDPSAEDWARLKRYASWMRSLHLSCHEFHSSDTLSQLSSNSPGGLLLPKLERLHWSFERLMHAIPFFRLFLSPHLQHVTLSTYMRRIPEHLLVPLAQMISLLPTSLEYLSFVWVRGNDELLDDAVSSFVCRCGPSMRSFETCAPLSEAATNHLMQLPNLSHWFTVQGPPRVIPTSIFPSLESVHLYKPEALPWLHLLSTHERGTLQDGSIPATSYTNIREMLRSLECPRTILNSTLLSSIVKFRNLVKLVIHNDVCPKTGDCTFRLTDDNMENLATTLPRLKNLRLGHPCLSNSCDVTVASLLSISVNCPDLTVLETHFSTQTIVSDMQDLLDGGAGCDRIKCKVRSLVVGWLPLRVSGKDTETVAMGFKTIFPCLTNFDCWGRDWLELNSKLGD